MWQKNLRYAFSLSLKNLQFKFATWRQGREIARAYGGRKRFVVSWHGLWAALVVTLCLCLPVALYLSAPNVKRTVSALQKIQRDVQKKFAARKAAVLVKESRDQEKAVLKKAGPAPRPLPDREAARSLPRSDTTGAQVVAPAGNGTFFRKFNYCILANKATRTLYVLNRTDPNGEWKSILDVSILLGKNDGQKMSAGDQRTPEGTYFIIGRKEAEELNAIYGPLAYVLNYPNEEDRKAGRTGQGIWIHGTREDTTREATRGCIVLNNDDLLTLAGHLQLGIGTPVVIVNAPALESPERALNYVELQVLRERILNEYDARQSEFMRLVLEWKNAWQSRDIDAYSRFYDPDRFSGEGMRWDAWREKKQRTFKAYNVITVAVDKLVVSEFSETTAVVLFLQRYESDVFRMQKPKKLSFYKSEGQWKIFHEETFSRQELLL